MVKWYAECYPVTRFDVNMTFIDYAESKMSPLTGHDSEGESDDDQEQPINVVKPWRLELY